VCYVQKIDEFIVGEKIICEKSGQFDGIYKSILLHEHSQHSSLSWLCTEGLAIKNDKWFK
jgi:hypothetical protein